MRDRTSAEPVPAQPSEQRPGRGLECGGRRAAAVTRRRGTWPPVTSSRVSLKLRLLKTPRTPDPGAAVNIGCWCWWLLVAAGGCWSPVWPRRTAECGAGTADSGQRTPRPRSTGGPGTRRTRHVCRDHSQAGDTWHVAPRDWTRGHTCLHHTGVSAASLPLSGPGAAYGGWWPGWPVPHHHLPPPALQLSNDLFAIHNIHNS